MGSGPHGRLWFCPVSSGTVNSPTYPVLTKCAARTETGRRPTNQDCVLASSPVFMVADGMGGHAAGDVASRIAVDTLASISGRTNTTVRDVVAAIREANRNIVDDVRNNPHRAGMGTTVSGLAVAPGADGPYAVVFNVGDSRTYLYRGGQLRALTVDHSMVQELVDAGEIKADDVFDHPNRNVVTRVLGLEEPVQIDTWAIPLAHSDRFVICSDGLSGVVPESLWHPALSVDEPAGCADHLIKLASACGSLDNVSVVVVDICGLDTSGEGDGDDTLPRQALPTLR